MTNKMYLSETDAILADVCGGIAEFFGFNTLSFLISHKHLSNYFLLCLKIG